MFIYTKLYYYYIYLNIECGSQSGATTEKVEIVDCGELKDN